MANNPRKRRANIIDTPPRGVQGQSGSDDHEVTVIPETPLAPRIRRPRLEEQTSPSPAPRNRSSVNNSNIQNTGSLRNFNLSHASNASLRANTDTSAASNAPLRANTNESTASTASLRRGGPGFFLEIPAGGRRALGSLGIVKTDSEDEEDDIPSGAQPARQGSPELDYMTRPQLASYVSPTPRYAGPSSSPEWDMPASQPYTEPVEGFHSSQGGNENPRSTDSESEFDPDQPEKEWSIPSSTEGGASNSSQGSQITLSQGTFDTLKKEVLNLLTPVQSGLDSCSQESNKIIKVSAKSLQALLQIILQLQVKHEKEKRTTKVNQVYDQRNRHEEPQLEGSAHSAILQWLENSTITLDSEGCYSVHDGSINSQATPSSQRSHRSDWDNMAWSAPSDVLSRNRSGSASQNGDIEGDDNKQKRAKEIPRLALSTIGSDVVMSSARSSSSNSGSNRSSANDINTLKLTFEAFQAAQNAYFRHTIHNNQHNTQSLSPGSIDLRDRYQRAQEALARLLTKSPQGTDMLLLDPTSNTAGSSTPRSDKMSLSGSSMISKVFVHQAESFGWSIHDPDYSMIDHSFYEEPQDESVTCSAAIQLANYEEPQDELVTCSAARQANYEDTMMEDEQL